MPFASESFYKRAESGFRGEQLTLGNRIRLEKLKVSQLDKRFPIFHGAQFIHKSPPLSYIMSQMNEVHALIPYFFNTPFNIIILPTTRSPSGICQVEYTFRFNFFSLCVLTE